MTPKLEMFLTIFYKILTNIFVVNSLVHSSFLNIVYIYTIKNPLYIYLFHSRIYIYVSIINRKRNT